MSVQEKVDALRKAGATEITVSRKGAVRGKFPPVVAVDPQQKPPQYIPVPYPVPTPVPTVNPPWYQPHTYPFTTWSSADLDTCLMRHFKPGEVAMVSCHCPRCSPRCSIGDYSLSATADGVVAS